MSKFIFTFLAVCCVCSESTQLKSGHQSKVYQPKSVQDTYSRDFEYFYNQLDNRMVQSSQTPQSVQLESKQQTSINRKINKMIEMLQEIKQMNQQMVLKAAKKKKFECDERFGFRWNRDMTLAIDCNWRYKFPVCGYDYSGRKRQTFKNECIACFIHRTIKSFTYGKC